MKLEQRGYVDLPGEITLDQMSDLVDEKKVLILDARPEIFHRLGYIPGALSLPRDDFENAYKILQSRLRAIRASRSSFIARVHRARTASW